MRVYRWEVARSLGASAPKPNLPAMRNFQLTIFATAAAGVLAIASSACSANGGFGSPAPPVPQNGQLGPQAYTSPGEPNPLSSVSPGPTTSPTTIYLSSSVVRAAYDGSAADPVKANRLLEIAFGFKNPTEDPDSFATLTVAADDDKIGIRTNLTLAIPPNKASDVAVAAIALKPDMAKIKRLTMTFENVDGDELATATPSPPPIALTYTPLDDKQPAGALTIVGLDFARVTGPGSGLHYECTFGLVNASGSKVVIDGFTVTPPKGALVQVAISVSVAPRTSTSLMTIILRFDGKSLPAGKYSVTANAANTALAQATAGLL